MKPGYATKEIIKFFRALYTGVAILFVAIGIIALCWAIYLWFANGWHIPDFYNVLFIVIWILFVLALRALNHWIWKRKDATMERLKMPTPEDIEAARKMLYGDKKK